MKIKSGDNVIVLAGKDRGKTGKVTRAFPREGKVVIDGVGSVKRHQRSRSQGKPGQIVERPMPIDVSNVALFDAKTKKPSRVGYVIDGNAKARVSKKSGTKLA